MAEKTEKKINGTFEKKLFKVGNKIRKNMDVTEHKQIVLGLILLKYISDPFENLNSKLQDGIGDYEGFYPEDADKYRGENFFWVSKKARWSYLHSRVNRPTIGKDIDETIEEIENENAIHKDILLKGYAQPNLEKALIGVIIDQARDCLKQECRQFSIQKQDDVTSETTAMLVLLKGEDAFAIAFYAYLYYVLLENISRHKFNNETANFVNGHISPQNRDRGDFGVKNIIK